MAFGRTMTGNPFNSDGGRRVGDEGRGAGRRRVEGRWKRGGGLLLRVEESANVNVNRIYKFNVRFTQIDPNHVTNRLKGVLHAQEKQK